jgi:predicted Zn-dependent protease
MGAGLYSLATGGALDKRGELLNLMSQARATGAKGVEVTRLWKHKLEQSDSRNKGIPDEQQSWLLSMWFEDGSFCTGSGLSREETLEQALASRQPASDPLGPVEKMDIRTAGTGVDDRRHGILRDEDRAEVLQLAEKALSGSPIKPDRLLYRQTRVGRAFVNSRGIEAEEYTTTFSLEGWATVEGLKLHHRIASRHFSDVASLPFGTELKRRLEPLSRRLPALPALPVVCEPRVVADLFRNLAPAFTADRIARGESFLKDFLGKAIASPIFHITDDAGLFGGLLSHAFDERGIPPIPVTLLKEGVVTGLYHDPNTAKLRGLRPTGHCEQGQLVPSNLVVRPGARTRNVVLNELGSYLLLDTLPPVSVETGMISGAVDYVVVERGEKKGSIRSSLELPVQKLLKAIKEVVSDHERTCEVDAPTAVFLPGFGA